MHEGPANWNEAPTLWSTLNFQNNDIIIAMNEDNGNAQNKQTINCHLFILNHSIKSDYYWKY